MTFWSSPEADPKRKYRFLVRIFSSEVAWYVKSVTAPSYEITSIEHAFSDHVFNFPGKIKWSDVEVTLVDPAGDNDVVRKTLDLIKKSGYDIPKNPAIENNEETAFKTFTKSSLVANNGSLIIETQDAEGKTVEQWTLHNAFITMAKFGDFDYNSEDMREISLTFKYDWASCEFKSGTYNGDEFFTNGPSSAE